MATLTGYIASSSSNTVTSASTVNGTYKSSTSIAYSSINTIVETTANALGAYVISTSIKYSSVNTSTPTTNTVTKGLYYSSTVIVGAAMTEPTAQSSIPTVGQIYPFINGTNN